MQNTFILAPTAKIIGIDGHPLRSNGADGANLQLSNAFTSAKSVTSSCFSIQQLQFNPITPKPIWYDDINKKFNTVKSLAATWLNDYAIAVTSTIPSSVLDYAPTFEVSSKLIQSLIIDSQFKPSEQQINAIANILTTLIDKINSINNDVSKYCHIDQNGHSKGLLVDWQKNMSEASNELKSGTNTVQKAAKDLVKQIEDLNQDIATLQSEISYYNKLVATGAGMVGGGTFIATVGGAMCFVCPIAGGIVLFLGIGSIIAGATIWGVYQGKINSAYRKIAENRTQITDKTEMLLKINAISSAAVSASDYADIAVRNLSDFSTSWVTLGNSVKQTLNNLKSSSKEVRTNCLKSLVSMGTAEKQWATVQLFAESLLSISPNVAVTDIKNINKI